MENTVKYTKAERRRFAEQTRDLRAARLPPVPVSGKNVSPASMQAVLNAIHSRAGVRGKCWASRETLASDTGLSVSQIKRCLAALRLLDLLIETIRRQGRRNVYDRTVCFSNLRTFVVEQKTFNLEAEDDVVDRSTTPLTGQPAPVDRSTCTPLTGQQLTPKYTRKNPIEESIKKKDGFLKIDSRKQLTDPAFVEQLWQLTLKANPGLYADTEFDRLRFFALAVHFAARWEQFKSPAGLFVTIARQGRAAIAEQINDTHDTPKAKRMLAELDGITLVGSADHQATALDDEWAGDDERHRQAMQRQAADLAALTDGQDFAALTPAQLEAIRQPSANMRSTWEGN